MAQFTGFKKGMVMNMELSKRLNAVAAMVTPGSVVCDVLEKCYISGVKDWNTLKTRIKDGVAKFLYNKTHRSPMVLPIIMEV